MPNKIISTIRARRFALAAHCDPRTIVKVLEGKNVRGMAGERAQKVLVDAGLLKASAA